jgi:hypothetical protein
VRNASANGDTIAAFAALAALDEPPAAIAPGARRAVRS